jgi:hypothetical protein
LVTVYPEMIFRTEADLVAPSHDAALRERGIRAPAGFTTMISRDDDEPLRPGSPHVLGTLRLAGDDVADYLNIGSRFSL